MAHEKRSYPEIDGLSTSEDQAKARHLIESVRATSRLVQAPPDFLAKTTAAIRHLPPSSHRMLSGRQWLPWIFSPVFACLVLMLMSFQLSRLRAELGQVQQHVENLETISGNLIVMIKASDDLSIQDGNALVCGQPDLGGKKLHLLRSDRRSLISIKVLDHSSCPQIQSGIAQNYPLVYINRSDETKFKLAFKSEQDDTMAYITQ